MWLAHGCVTLCDIVTQRGRGGCLLSYRDFVFERTLLSSLFQRPPPSPRIFCALDTIYLNPEQIHIRSYTSITSETRSRCVARAARVLLVVL